jgi:hypothetical protein
MQVAPVAGLGDEINENALERGRGGESWDSGL